MKIQQLLFLASISGLSSCMWGVPKQQKAGITKDTLTYAYHTIKERAPDCGAKPDSSCTIVKFKYPVFNSQSVLNDTVTHKLLSLFATNKTDNDLPQFIKHFMTGYLDYKKHDPRSSMIFTLDSHAKLLRQDSSLTTLEISGYTFQGGAHGSTIVTFINWNTKSEKNIALNDILVNGYEDKLNKIAERIFRKQENLSDTASLASNYFFKGNKFALNNNFSITPLGIRFLYNQYEIKPYAAGQTDLFIPYGQIKSLLLPNTVVTQYTKK